MFLQRRFFKVIVTRVATPFYHTINHNQLAKMSTSTTASATQSAIVAVLQFCSTADKAANLQQVEDLVAKAKSEAATFIFLPECCDFVGENRKQTIELSEPLTGTLMQQYKAIAKKHSVWLSLGGVHECILDAADCKTDKLYNTHVLIDEGGDIVSVYRKLHLFDVDTPDFRFKESDVVSPGSSLVLPVPTPIGQIGLQICYDMRFAEASILLRKLGAQILTYPSAFTYITGQAHWEVLQRARAIENQCFVISAAQVGYHNKKRRSWGHAMIVNPWGKVLADCGEQEAAVATAEIDLASICPVRTNMPCFNHRRGDIYTLTMFEQPWAEPQEDRLFAKSMIQKETIFYETEHCFAFTNLRCVVEGHVLISTKRVTPRLNGLDCSEMADLFTTACKIQRMLEEIYQTKAATVTVQDGTDAGQTMPHVHFHIMPRRPGDFGHNDQIYHKMEDRCEDKPDRHIDERIAEATKYKEFLKTKPVGQF